MRTALVTGASSGIGSAIVRELAKDNIHIILTARDEKKLQSLKDQIGNAEIISANLNTIEGINLLIQKVKDKYSEMNILINAAGIWHKDNKVLADIDFEDFDQQTIIDTINVGTLAPMLLANAIIPLMTKKSKIVNISGTFESGAKGWLPYYVSKKAIEDLTVGLAQDLKDKDIQVNAVSPSDTATDAYKRHFPQYIKDAIKPDKVAKQVAYLCSTKADNMTGKVFVVKKDQKSFQGFHI